MFSLICALLTSLPSGSSSAPPEGAWTDSTWRSDQLYIAVFTLGPAWDQSRQAHEQDGFKEHSANLARLRREGRALIGARYGAKGMIVFGASGLDDAKAQFAGDPMIARKLFVLELEKFTPFHEGCVPG